MCAYGVNMYWFLIMLLLWVPISSHAQFTNTHYDQDHYIFWYENGSARDPAKAQDAYVINSYGHVLQKWLASMPLCSDISKVARPSWCAHRMK